MSKFKPLPHQKSCLKRISKIRRTTNKALVIMASGLGKTVIAAFDIKDWLLSNPGGHVLYLCHQNNILEQAKEKFENIIGTNSKTFGLYHGEIKEIDAQILFASFQTMRRHLKRFSRHRFGYVIVDESHHSQAKTYRPIINYFKPKFLLGITATPDRRDLQDIRRIFGKEIFSLELPEALSDKLLADVDYRLVTDELIDLSKIKIEYRLTLKDLNKRLFIPKRDDEIVKIIRRRIFRVDDPRIMVFCSSIEHANRFCSHIPEAIAIHSALPQFEQVKKLEDFRAGHKSIAVTVDKFNEGIDIPEINVIIFLRSTQSNTVFLQQLGRGLRKVPGKKNVLVLDFIANCDRVKMIYDLVKKINKRKRKYKKISRYKKTVVIKGLKFKFTEKAKEILNILERIRKPYSKQDLIEYIKIVADELGRPPKEEDFDFLSKQKIGWGPTTIRKVFGSIYQSLKEANIEGSQKKRYSRSEIIFKIKKLVKELGFVPGYRYMRKISKNYGLPSANTITAIFGTYNNAIKSAGFRPVMSTVRICGKIDKDILIKQLINIQKKVKGKKIGQKEINYYSKYGLCASYYKFFKEFGSIPFARQAAKILS